VRHTEGRELARDVRPVGVGGGRERLAGLPTPGVHLDPPPRFRVDEPEVADVGQRVLAPVADLERRDLVARGEPQERVAPVARPEEVGDDEDHASLPGDGVQAFERRTERRRAHLLGLGLLPRCKQCTDQPAAPWRCGRPPLLTRHNSWRTLRARAAGSVRPQDLIAITGNLHAAIAIGAEPAFAIERANPPRPGADRIERIEAGELHIEPGPGIVIE
jgi:hypothetical protein